MGYTFRPEEGRGGDAMEGKFCDGRTDAFRDSAQGRGKHGLVVPRVWNFTQDRIQDPGPLRAVRGGGLSDRTRRPHRYANQLPAPTDSSISRNYPCGGCVWGSASNVFAPVIPNKMAATSACI